MLISKGVLVDDASFCAVKIGSCFDKVVSSGRNVVGKSVESNKVVSSHLQTHLKVTGE